MKRICLALMAVSLAACAPKAANDDSTAVRQTATTNDKATVQAAIDAALTGFTEGMKKGDTAAMVAPYAEDAIVLSAGAPAARGHAGIKKLNAGMMAGFTVPAAKITSEDLIVTGDYAIETGKYEMTLHPKKGKDIQDVGKYVAVWKKQADGSWKMIRDSYSTDKPAM